MRKEIDERVEIAIKEMLEFEEYFLVRTLINELSDTKEKYHMPSVKNLIKDKLREIKEALNF
jgi:hypothetical protein